MENTFCSAPPRVSRRVMASRLGMTYLSSIFNRMDRQPISGACPCRPILREGIMTGSPLSRPMEQRSFSLRCASVGRFMITKSGKPTSMERICSKSRTTNPKTRIPFSRRMGNSSIFGILTCGALRQTDQIQCGYFPQNKDRKRMLSSSGQTQPVMSAISGVQNQPL